MQLRRQDDVGIFLFLFTSLNFFFSCVEHMLNSFCVLLETMSACIWSCYERLMHTEPPKRKPQWLNKLNEWVSAVYEWRNVKQIARARTKTIAQLFSYRTPTIYIPFEAIWMESERQMRIACANNLSKQRAHFFFLIQNYKVEAVVASGANTRLSVSVKLEQRNTLILSQSQCKCVCVCVSVFWYARVFDSVFLLQLFSYWRWNRKQNCSHI